MGALIVSALVSGSIYALVSLGFAIAFRVSGVFNFTHGGLLVAAAYVNYYLATLWGFPTWFSAPISILIVGSFGYIIESWAILTAKQAGLISVDLLVLTWLGLFVIQGLLSIAFSNASIYMGRNSSGPALLLFGSGITSLQIGIVVISFFSGFVLFLFSRRSATGREVSAVGDNLRLAMICGIDVRRIIRLNSLAAAILTTSAGVLLSYQERIDPSLGIRFSIIAIVSSLAGFRFGPGGAVIGGFVLAFLESMVLYLVDPGLRNLAVYACLFLIVLWTYRRSVIPKT